MAAATETTTQDTRYNGWTNYETWNVALWIDNEQGSYSEWREKAKEAYSEAGPTSYSNRKEVAARSLGRQLKDSIEEGNPLSSAASMYSDILTAAISEVNWDEIAENWIDDIAAEVEEDEADPDEDEEDETDD